MHLKLPKFVIKFVIITSAHKTASYNLAPTLDQFEAKPNTRKGWVSHGHFKVGFSEGAKVAFPIDIKS